MIIDNPNANDVEEGHVLKLQGKNKFFKVTDIGNPDSAEFKAKPVFPDEEDREVVVNIGKCDKCLSAHSFGQHKRFRSGGTGFKRRGRKLKKNRSDVFEQEVDRFMEGQVGAEDLLEDVDLYSEDREMTKQKVRQDIETALNRGGIALNDKISRVASAISKGFSVTQSDVEAFIKNSEDVKDMVIHGEVNLSQSSAEILDAVLNHFGI